MTDIIGNWLLESIRCNIKCTPEILGKACYDGKIFAQILVTYNVCSSDYLKLINEAVNKKVALSNLKKLCVWFKLLGISTTDEFLNEIVNQNGSASLRLLYELFIRLENKESMLYVDRKKMQRVLSESTDKFHVTPAEDVEILSDIVDDKQYLRDILNTMQGVMENAEQNSLKKFLIRGMKHRAEVVKKKIMKDDFPPHKCFVSKPTFPHLDVQAKINEFEELLESPEGKDNQTQTLMCDPEEYVSYLKMKRRKEEADKKLKLKLEKYSMEDAWKKILDNQELELKKLLSMKLLKQSEYEKQMTLRFKRLRLRYLKFIGTRDMVMNMAEKAEIVNQYRSSFTVVKDHERTQIEKNRIKELHQRLFNEKMKLKKRGDVEACRRIVEDLVDFAMIKSGYVETNGMEMPRNKTIELKLLFMKGNRLLPHDIIPKVAREEDLPIILDDERLGELAEYDFFLYMYRIGPWHFPKRTGHEKEQLNITGFIIHRLLDLKYDFSLSSGEPADLPEYHHKVFIHHMNDTFALEKLKHYLSKFKVEVFDTSQVINHFLNSYKAYKGIEIIKESAKQGSPLKNKLNSVPTVKTEKVKIKPWIGSSDKVKESLKADKVVQFPSAEKLVKEKTLASELGKCVYDILQAGGLLPDSFVCHLIIEYLKELRDIDGWVLINYPENITQVAILEFMFSGLEVPYMSKITQNIRKLIRSQLQEAMPKSPPETRYSNSNISEDINEDYETQTPEQYSVEDLLELKNSNILPRPNLPPEPLKFESFFTKVIILQHETEKKGKISIKHTRKSSFVREESMEEKVTLESFYASQRVSFTFSYKYYDTITLKKLLTIILNIAANQQNEFMKNLEKGISATVKLVKQQEKQEVSPKPLKYKRHALDDWVLKTFLENEEGVFEEIGEEEEVEDEIIIFPGHKDWEYTKLAIPEFYVGVLATLWESIEYFFTCNLKRCFALLRTVERRVMPYRNYVRKKAEECLTLNDDRTEAVTNFQLMLNKINDHYRPLDSMKNELHNRILKLQCDLWKMTDVKKFYCEQVFELIMSQNWIANHLTNILQVYSLILQVEADRFADTMQLIEDYYTISILGKENNDRITKIVLPNIALKAEKRDETRRYSKHQATTGSFKRGRIFEQQQDKQQHGRMAMASELDPSRTLSYFDFNTENPALSLLKSLITKLTKSITHIKTHCEQRSNSAIEKVKESHKLNTKSESRTGTTSHLQSRKQTLKDLNEGTELLISTLSKISLEWSFAIDYETKRALYRVDLIEQRATADINEDHDIIESTFDGFKQDIINLYHNQILNVDKVCDLMRAAVEEEVKIQPLVVLKNQTLEIDTSTVLYPIPPPPPPSSLVETATGFKFTISQLTNLFYKLVYVAPYGIIEQTFVLILEDMASIGHETGHSYLPPYWSDLSSDKIKDIVHRLYGKKIVIDWRLFIIFGLDLGYPSLEDILEMKNSFELYDPNLSETATYEQYSCVFLWFENMETLSIRQDLYIAKAKELIFKLFQIEENLMNYTDFLLAFCRDFDPREGFVKALALVEGCATISWKQDLFRETFQIEKENEKYNIAYGILVIVMAGVYQIVDSVIITDLNEEFLLTPACSTTSIPHKKSNKPTLRKRRRSITAPTSDERHFGEEDGPESQGEETLASPLTTLDLTTKEQPQILWKSDVYFSTVFSLLMLDIHQFALSADQIFEPFLLEENLMRVYREKGKNNTMKLFHLLTDVYVQKIFTKYRCFQAFSLPQLLLTLAKDDCSSAAEQD